MFKPVTLIHLIEATKRQKGVLAPWTRLRSVPNPQLKPCRIPPIFGESGNLGYGIWYLWQWILFHRYLKLPYTRHFRQWER